MAMVSFLSFLEIEGKFVHHTGLLCVKFDVNVFFQTDLGGWT